MSNAVRACSLIDARRPFLHLFETMIIEPFEFAAFCPVFVRSYRWSLKENDTRELLLVAPGEKRDNKSSLKFQLSTIIAYVDNAIMPKWKHNLKLLALEVE